MLGQAGYGRRAVSSTAPRATVGFGGLGEQRSQGRRGVADERMARHGRLERLGCAWYIGKPDRLSRQGGQDGLTERLDDRAKAWKCQNRGWSGAAKALKACRK